MVYTITFNPALDYVMNLNKISFGEINLSDSENIFPGGKGINVSVVLKELGIDNTALGFIAGFSGEEIERQLTQKGVICDFVKLERGNSRINVKLRYGAETDINTIGPDIDETHMQRFLKKIDNLNSEDVVVVAGSLPKGLDNTAYKSLAKHFKDRNIRFIIDATKDSLLSTLEYEPFLIKPNLEELGDLFEDFDESKLQDYMKRLQSMGAKNVLVSMGGKGSALLDETGNFDVLDAIDGEVVNTVGAGDSMVAGFLAGYIKTSDLKFAHRLGCVAGSATAFSEGLAQGENILSLLEKNS